MNPLVLAPNPDNLPLLFLGYSLLIILICAAALVKIVIKWQQGRYTQGFRMMLGLLGLLILRLAVFLITYLNWRVASQMTPVYLFLDLASSLIGILLIAWMWNYPERSQAVDLVLVVLIAFTTALVSLP